MRFALDDKVKKNFDAAGIKAPHQTVEVMQTGNDVASADALPTLHLRRLNQLGAGSTLAFQTLAAGGATWVSLHHGVGVGFSQHSSVMIVCDGTARSRCASWSRIVE